MQKKKFSKLEMVLSAAVVFLFAAVLTVGAAGPAGEKSMGAQMRADIDQAPTDDIQKVAACPFCGMNRQQFAHSRVFIEYDDGSVLGTCSIHCAAADLAVHLDKAPVKFWVGDYNTKKLIDAETAAWTIGGDKMGVMTKRAKWAFSDAAAADQYIKAHGGQTAGFEQAMEATYADMYKDTKMIRERRAKKRMMKTQHAK